MFEIKRGKPDPLGVTLTNGGANFSIFSRNATTVYLYVFDNFYDTNPIFEYEFDNISNRTGDTWHVWVKDVNVGTYYGYRIDGPYSPENGHRFNVKKFLIDPYAKAVTSSFQLDMRNDAIYGYNKYSEYSDLSFNNKDSLPAMPKGIIIDDDEFDWGNEKRPCLDPRDRIIYEVHVRGFTKNPNSKVKNPGTFEGFLEKLDHLKELGINSVELLPVFAFNPESVTNKNPITGERLYDYWGYNPLSFFALASQYTNTLGLKDQIDSFKNFVKELHSHGFEIILDVVYNHTGEGNELGPTVNFRGIDNSIYYMLDDINPRYYKNYSGCGNTLNCNHPIAKRLIIDSLRHWYVDMHVDGFRFDLAAILGRAPNGKWIGDLSLLNDISKDRILSKAHLIAEGWDAAGGYFIGDFPVGWSEWNGKFRDTVRIMVKGKNNVIADLATRIAGSSDLYGNGRKPYNSINFITCHDGFTLWDLVSYNKKHNEANGLNNKDGSNDNHSFNCGIEGETNNPRVIKARKKMIRNFITLLMISQGTPMILAGDEFGNTQFGNNNPYCQDNEISWIDWSLKEKNFDMFTYFKKMTDFRKKHYALRRKHFFEGSDHSDNSLKDINWYSRDGSSKNWSDGEKTLSFIVDGHRQEIGWDHDDDNIFVLINFEDIELPFSLPEFYKSKWKMISDTNVGFFDSPIIIEHNVIYLSPKSIVVMVSENGRT
jgi:glycogen operon protein